MPMRVMPSLGMTGSTSVPPFPFGLLVVVALLPLLLLLLLDVGVLGARKALCGVWGVGRREAAEMSPLVVVLRVLAPPVGVLVGAPFLNCGLGVACEALAVAGVLVGLRPIAMGWPGVVERIARPARWLAGISFTLYLFHWPMLNLCRVIGINAGESPLAFAAILLAMIALCDMIARVTEHQRQRVRALLDRLPGGKAGAPLAIRSPSP